METGTNVETIYERLGGEPAITAAVERFYARVLADEVLRPYFTSTDLAWLKRRQAQFLTQALGGPAAYRGRPMRQAHRGMGVTSEHFDAVAGHLVATLESLQVPPALVGEVVAIVGPLKSEIVE